MWFKNARLYRLTESWELSPEHLAEKLSEFSFNPCGSLDPMRYGFVGPVGEDLVHASNGFIMICAKKQEKILPSGVIKEALEEKVQSIRDAEGRSVSRKERDSMKDEIIFSLLPKAFTKSSFDYAYIAPADGLIVVNTGSPKRAEDLLSKLREALGSLRCLTIAPKNLPAQIMTQWLRIMDPPSQFELGEFCELRGAKDDSEVRTKKIDLTSTEISHHLINGMHVSKVSLCWKESISFVIDDHLGIKRIKFEDVIAEKANDRNPETKAEQFDADFTIMTLELQAMFKALLSAFGGDADNDISDTETKPAERAAIAVDDAEDSMFPEAVKFVVESQKALISALQRQLRVHYNKAARMIELMEVRGIVSPASHTGERKVLVSASSLQVTTNE